MTISIGKYVLITSGVAGASNVANRELIGRVFSDNLLTPVNGVLEFQTADAVGAYYGTNTEEYKRAVAYFGFIAKNISSPPKISFGRWAKVAAAARIFGGKSVTPLASFVAVVAGALSATVGGQTANIVGLDLSGAASLAAVAALLQTAFRAAAGTQFTNALVVYDAVGQKFNFTASTVGAADISVAPGALATLLGWVASPPTTYSPGTPVQTLTDAMTTSADISNNFGSFCFVPVLLTAETVEVAVWNDVRNVEFMFCPRFTDLADAQTLYAAMAGLSGWAMTKAPLATEYPEMDPMMIMAATDYTRRNSTQNYMYQQFAGQTPSVSTTSESDALDLVRGNYIGVTQTAGRQISFYQRGIMGGLATDPVDCNTYANEMWFKDAARTAIMNLQLAVSRVPANNDGRGMILGCLQEPIDLALFNGTISVGKDLNANQRLAVTLASGDPDAWRQVENIGYWVDVVMESYVTPDNRTEWKAVYTLIYGKDDAVRKVTGDHILI